MLIPPEELLDGAVATLLEAVLPALGTRFARSQLYAVVDVLRNLRDRVEPRCAGLAAEAASAEAALRRAAEALRPTAPAAAESLSRGLDALPAAPIAARLEALGPALVAAFETLESLPPAAAEAAVLARSALAGHLAAQALRDLAPLKPSLLAEISRG